MRRAGCPGRGRAVLLVPWQNSHACRGPLPLNPPFHHLWMFPASSLADMWRSPRLLELQKIPNPFPQDTWGQLHTPSKQHLEMATTPGVPLWSPPHGVGGWGPTSLSPLIPSPPPLLDFSLFPRPSLPVTPSPHCGRADNALPVALSPNGHAHHVLGVWSCCQQHFSPIHQSDGLFLCAPHVMACPQLLCNWKKERLHLKQKKS